MNSRPLTPEHAEPPERFEATRSKLLSRRPINHDCLRDHAFFKDRDPKLFDLLVNHVRVEVFLQGDDIIKEGEEGTTMYFLYRGAVAILIGPELKQVAVLRDGSLFGELALLGNGKRACTVRAIEVCDCRVINSEAFHVVLRRFPAEKAYFVELARERCKQLNKDPPKTSAYSSNSARKIRRSSNVVQAASKIGAVLNGMRRKSAPTNSCIGGTHQQEAPTNRSWPLITPTSLQCSSRDEDDDKNALSDATTMSEDEFSQPEEDRRLVQTHGFTEPSIDNHGAHSVPCSLFCTPPKNRHMEDPRMECFVNESRTQTPRSTRSIFSDHLSAMSPFSDVDAEELLSRPPARHLQFDNVHSQHPPQASATSPSKRKVHPCDGKRRGSNTEFPTLLTASSAACEADPRGGYGVGSTCMAEKFALDCKRRVTTVDELVSPDKKLFREKPKPAATKATTTGDLAAYIMGTKGGRRDSRESRRDSRESIRSPLTAKITGVELPNQRNPSPRLCQNGRVVLDPIPQLSGRRASSGGGLLFQSELID